jgi:hypothetical protein
MRGYFLVHITVTLRERSLEHEISLIAWLLPVAPLHGTFEVKARAVDDLGGKTQVVAVQFAGFEELIEECSLVALLVSKS